MTLDNITSAALRTALDRVEHAAKRVGQAVSPAVEPKDRLELSTEIVQLLKAQRDFEVTVEVARTADKTTRSALDLVG